MLKRERDSIFFRRGYLVTIWQDAAYLFATLGGLAISTFASAVTLKIAIFGHNAFVRRDWPSSVVRMPRLGEAALINLAIIIVLTVAVVSVVVVAPADTLLPRLKFQPAHNPNRELARPAETLVQKSVAKQAERQVRQKVELFGAIRLYSWLCGIFFVAAGMLAMLLPTTFLRASLVTFYSAVMLCGVVALAVGFYITVEIILKTIPQSVLGTIHSQ